MAFDPPNAETLRGPVPLWVVLGIQPIMTTTRKMTGDTTTIADGVPCSAFVVRGPSSTAGARWCGVGAERCRVVRSSVVAKWCRRGVKWRGMSRSAPRTAVSATAFARWPSAGRLAVAAVVRGVRWRHDELYRHTTRFRCARHRRRRYCDHVLLYMHGHGRRSRWLCPARCRCVGGVGARSRSLLSTDDFGQHGYHASHLRQLGADRGIGWLLWPGRRQPRVRLADRGCFGEVFER